MAAPEIGGTIHDQSAGVIRPARCSLARWVRKRWDSVWWSAMVTPALSGEGRPHPPPVGGLAQGGGSEGQQLDTAGGVRGRAGPPHDLDQPGRALPGQSAAAVDLLGQPQLGLLRRKRGRGRAAVGVDHQQVHGVRADVQHARTLAWDLGAHLVYGAGTEPCSGSSPRSHPVCASYVDDRPGITYAITAPRHRIDSGG